MIEFTDDPSKFDMHDYWYRQGVKAGRAEAFEEAAKMLDRERQPMLADAIRALAKETPK